MLQRNPLRQWNESNGTKKYPGPQEVKSHRFSYYNSEMRFALLFTLFFSLTFAAGECTFAQAKLARVAAPVADLRTEPAAASSRLEHDPLQESQLLYGEEVEILEELDGWAKVSAVEQREWNHNNQWEGYPGWVELRALAAYRNDRVPNLMVTSKLATVRAAPLAHAPGTLTLSFGSRLIGMELAVPKNGKSGDPEETWWRLTMLDETIGWIRAEDVTPLSVLMETRSDPAAVRAHLMKMARLFLGDPYYWGGRSAYNPETRPPPHWGCDCSGLVGLLYQVSGLRIPRDAHEIWMQARVISREELSAGDLIFLSKPEDPNRIGHIMLYCGDGKVIEAPSTGYPVREVSLTERLKESEGRKVSYGAYLP